MAKKKKSSGKKASSSVRKFIIAFIGVVFVAGLITAYSFYSKVFSPNIVLQGKSTAFIYIPTGAKFNDVLSLLNKEGMLKNSASFEWVAQQMNYDKNVKPGKYQIKSGMSNKQIVGLLRSGKQTPVRLTFSNLRTVEQLAGIVGSKIEADSAEILFLFKDDAYQSKFGFTGMNSLAVMIPNTYEFYWNCSAEQFFEKILKEYNKFWTEDRMQKAKAEGMSLTEVSTLASIVEQETRKVDEKPTVAGVYINRLRKGWKLEADPTLVYALGDFTVRRVLNEYKEIDSPYNTYMYTGLPPGPICMPSVTSIDAVLNYKQHDFLFFCAREDFSGYHSFARSYEVHMQNARRFQKELNKRSIKS